MSLEELFTPLEFRNLTLRNRVLRSNISGRFDHYDGTGTQTRINWELKFARGGVGAIVSSWCGVHRRGFIVPGYASIETDDRIPFWRELGRRVHEHGCPYILQLAFGGRQRDVNGVEFERGWSSTDKPDPLHGFQCERMTKAQIEEVTDAFAEGARRAKEAGLDGVEIHGANGYVFTQFLSSAINDRDDEYGGSLENRARFLLDTVRAIRAQRRRRLPPAGQAQRDRVRRRPDAVGEEGQHDPGLGRGGALGRAGRSGCDPRLVREHVPPSGQSRPARSRPRTSSPPTT